MINIMFRCSQRSIEQNKDNLQVKGGVADVLKFFEDLTLYGKGKRTDKLLVTTNQCALGVMI